MRYIAWSSKELRQPRHHSPLWFGETQDRGHPDTSPGRVPPHRYHPVWATGLELARGFFGLNKEGRSGVSLLLKVGFLFWFLVFCALASAWFYVGAVRDLDRQLAWYSAIAFILFCALAVAELVWRLP